MEAGYSEGLLMAHILLELQGDKYRLSINDADEWVGSNGPMQEILVDMLNTEAPMIWFKTRVIVRSCGSVGRVAMM